MKLFFLGDLSATKENANTTTPLECGQKGDSRAVRTRCGDVPEKKAKTAGTGLDGSSCQNYGLNLRRSSSGHVSED